jgi:tRNA modification GTPase
VDFPDEGYHFIEPRELASVLGGLVARLDALLACGRRGRLVREGLQVAIVGKPNVGKSSLFNALAGAGRAIVTPIAGTTRDLVTEVVDVDGLRVTLVDTAGLREGGDDVEAEGVARARGARRVADLVLVVLDASRPLDGDDRIALNESTGLRHLVVLNKTDLVPGVQLRPDSIPISALTGGGVDELRAAMARALDAEPSRDSPAITNVRHLALMERAREALARAATAVATAGGALSEEFVLADLQDARAAFEEITGRRTPDDVLAHIFERFCIGK